MVGKTASCVNIGGALAETGRAVLLVDLDPQGHLTEALKVSEAPAGVGQPNLANALTDRVAPLGELAVEHSRTEAGGRLEIHSAPEQGTLVRVEVPVS